MGMTKRILLKWQVSINLYMIQHNQNSKSVISSEWRQVTSWINLPHPRAWGPEVYGQTSGTHLVAWTCWRWWPHRSVNRSWLWGQGPWRTSGRKNMRHSSARPSPLSRRGSRDFPGTSPLMSAQCSVPGGGKQQNRKWIWNGQTTLYRGVFMAADLTHYMIQWLLLLGPLTFRPYRYSLHIVGEVFFCLFNFFSVPF